MPICECHAVGRINEMLKTEYLSLPENCKHCQFTMPCYKPTYYNESSNKRVKQILALAWKTIF